MQLAFIYGAKHENMAVSKKGDLIKKVGELVKNILISPSLMCKMKTYKRAVLGVGRNQLQGFNEKY